MTRTFMNKKKKKRVDDNDDDDDDDDDDVSTKKRDKKRQKSSLSKRKSMFTFISYASFLINNLCKITFSNKKEEKNHKKNKK